MSAQGKGIPVNSTNQQSDAPQASYSGGYNRHSIPLKKPNDTLLSEEQEARYKIMRLAGEYLEITDLANQEAMVEQHSLIESSTRPNTNLWNGPKVYTTLRPKKENLKKIFDDHIQAAQSIIRVHGKMFLTKIPEVKLIAAGGRFVDKIHRINMIYSSEKVRFDEEFYAIMLFSYLEDLNNHEERFRPYLSNFPLTSENYELRIMLPDYKTVSSKESPKPAFIFNIGDTVYLCHRENQSKQLQIYKRVEFGKIIENINHKIPLDANRIDFQIK
jgi:hypothetical protein